MNYLRSDQLNIDLLLTWKMEGKKITGTAFYYNIDTIIFVLIVVICIFSQL